MAEQMELVRTVDNLIDLARKKGFRAAGPIVESNGTSLDERLAITRAEVTALGAMTFGLISKLRCRLSVVAREY